MQKRAQRLGKGLSALITVRPTDTATGAPAATVPPPADRLNVHSVPVDRIRPNPRQPRSSIDQDGLAALAASIGANGVIQPIILRAIGDDSYELVAGERRWRAAQLAKLERIPAIVREASDAESLELALIENLQREDLAPLERAAAYQQFLDSFGGTVEDLAKRLAESRANVSNYLRLLKLQPEICYMLGRGELGMGQARAIAGIADPQRQLAIARLAARRNLSVRQVEELARQASEIGDADTAQEPAPPPRQIDRHLADVERALSRATGLRVRLRLGRKKNAGRVIISYSNLDEFDRIAERLGGDVRLE